MTGKVWIGNHLSNHSTMIASVASNTAIRDANAATYAYAPLGAFTKILMDTVVLDTEGMATTTRTTANISAITAGNTTQVTLSGNPWNAGVGDALLLSGITGADAAFVNQQSFPISAVSGNVFSLNVNTTGKTLVATGTAENDSYSTIMVPDWAKYVRVTGHISFPDQNVAAGHASVHLWRSVRSGALTQSGLVSSNYGGGSGAAWVGLGNRPTPEAHYHNRIYYPSLISSSYISVLAHTPWIPVMAVNEVWSLYAWQDTTATVNTPVGVEQWLAAEFM